MNPWNAVFISSAKDLSKLVDAGIYGKTSAGEQAISKYAHDYWFRFSAEDPFALCGYASGSCLPEVYDSESPNCNWPCKLYTCEEYVDLLLGVQQKFLSDDLREVLQCAI